MDLIETWLIRDVIIGVKIFSHWNCDIIMYWLGQGIFKFIESDVRTGWPRVWLAFHKYLAGASCSGYSKFNNLSKTILHQWFCRGVKFSFSNGTRRSFAMFEWAIGDHRAWGYQHVVPDCLCGGLIDGFITNCVCDLFKRLKMSKKLNENNGSNRETFNCRGVMSNPWQHMARHYRISEILLCFSSSVSTVTYYNS